MRIMSRQRSDADLFGEDAPPRKRGRPVADHRQQLVLEQAEGQRIKNAKLRGELVERTAVAAEWSAICLDVRAALQSIPSKFGARHGLSPSAVADLNAMMRDALDALGDDAEPSDG
jgi:phage terminase Nu1 subunit (DNA packaging protein)